MMNIANELDNVRHRGTLRDYNGVKELANMTNMEANKLYSMVDEEDFSPFSRFQPNPPQPKPDDYIVSPEGGHYSYAASRADDRYNIRENFPTEQRRIIARDDERTPGIGMYPQYPMQPMYPNGPQNRQKEISQPLNFQPQYRRVIDANPPSIDYESDIDVGGEMQKKKSPCMESYEHYNDCPVCSNLHKSKTKMFLLIIALLVIIIICLLLKED